MYVYWYFAISPYATGKSLQLKFQILSWDVYVLNVFHVISLILANYLFE